MSIELPNLPYADHALEPHISAETLRIHHAKHHRGYGDKLNFYSDRGALQIVMTANADTPVVYTMAP